MALGSLNDPIGLAFPMLRAEWPSLTNSDLALCASAATVGQVGAALFAGPLCDRFGRRATARCGMLLVLLAAIAQVRAGSLRIVSVARFLGGLGLGAQIVAMPTLLSECLPAGQRRYLTMYQAGWPTGACITAVALFASSSWRSAFCVTIPIVVASSLLLFTPGAIVESPRSLLTRGQVGAAQDALQALGSDFKIPVEKNSDNDSHQGQDSSLTSEAASPSKDMANSPSKTAGAGVWALLPVYLLVMTMQGMPSQLVKVWLPTFAKSLGIGPSDDASGGAAFVSMWCMEVVFIASIGYLLGGKQEKLHKDCSDESIGLLPQLRVSQLAYFCGTAVVIANLLRPPLPIFGLLGGMHLMAQASAFNFFIPFAAASFDVASRARGMGILFMANYAGAFAGPLLGAWLLEKFPAHGPRIAIVVASMLFFTGGAACELIRRRKLAAANLS
eukprot:TRINITY_DN17070_c0_g2_i1.p1 TRINITY_DN17070_c0_g2~~TRINITY_DN17070_c0_g2_i1.p1  ORF type:complete len:478 (-),score=47.23 TRINITY_DN17070_c0_g2_i1:265-1599(-)